MKVFRMLVPGLAAGFFLISGATGWAMGNKPPAEETAEQNLKGMREHLAERPVETRAVQIESGLIETGGESGKP